MPDFDLKTQTPKPSDARTANTNHREVEINRSSLKVPAMLRGRNKSVFQAYTTTNVAMSQPAELPTDLNRVTSGFAFNHTDGVFVPVTVTPKATSPGTAVISGLVSSKTYLIVVFGDN